MWGTGRVGTGQVTRKKNSSLVDVFLEAVHGGTKGGWGGVVDALTERGVGIRRQKEGGNGCN